MGTLAGHALPGSFFIIFALWWTVQMLHRFFLCQKTKTKFRSTAIYNCSCLCGKLNDWPVEAVVKIVFGSVGITTEIPTGFASDGHFMLKHWQHITMYFSFGLTGVIDMLVYFKAPLPPDMDYISFILAFACEFMLFKFHLHGRTDLDVFLHTLIMYTIAASLLATLAELKYRDNILCALARSYFTLLQGTWFWQLGLILYSPFKALAWDQEDPDQIMKAIIIFVWHGVVNFLLILVIGFLVAFFHIRCDHFTGTTYSSPHDSARTKRRHARVNGNNACDCADEESGSETDFEKEPMLP